MPLPAWLLRAPSSCLPPAAEEEAGGGEAAFKLRLAATNETAESATVTLAVDGTAGEPQTLESCKGKAFDVRYPGRPGDVDA